MDLDIVLKPSDSLLECDPSVACLFLSVPSEQWWTTWGAGGVLHGTVDPSMRDASAHFT